MIDKSEKSAPINLSTAEIARFDALAESWWDPNGKYKTALDFNRARLEVIEQQIRQHFNRQHVDAPAPNGNSNTVSHDSRWKGYVATKQYAVIPLRGPLEQKAE